MTPTNTSNFSPETETSVVQTDAGLIANKILSPRKKRNSIFLPEIVALVLSGLALLSIIFTYLGGFLPAQEELKRRQSKRDQLETQLQEHQARSNDFHSKESSMTEVVNSIGRFEENFLPIAAQGNSVLYERINQLIRTNNLRNTAGPEYTVISAVGADKAIQTERNMKDSLFPGTTVSLTVEGSYTNLRHFIADLENSKQFLVINAIEIESNGEKSEPSVTTNNLPAPTGQLAPNNSRGNVKLPNTPNNLPNSTGTNPNRISPRLQSEFPNSEPQPPSNQASKERGGAATVSLRLEMAAYFKRPAVVSTTAQN
jgi:Tfp pilus assembly protein PilO